MTGLAIFALFVLVIGVVALVVALRSMLPAFKENRTLKSLLREASSDRDMLRQQVRIIRAERDDWITKCKHLMMPEVE